MNISALLANEDAVTPVIGIILMVAIAVILAAIVGVFALGIGEETAKAQPTTNFEFDYTDGGTSGCSSLQDGSPTGDLEVKHNGGDTIVADRLTLHDDEGSSVQWTCGGFGPDSDVTTGDAETFQVGSDDTVKVVWTAETGGDSAPIGEWDGPDA